MSNRKENTPFLPGFQVLFRGRPNISPNELMKRTLSKMHQHTMEEFRQLFSCFIPTSAFSLDYGKDFSRSRIYTLELIFWAFLNQILLNNTSCSEIVKKVQSWKMQKNSPLPSSATGAYCRAKKKLRLSFLKNIFGHTAQALLRKERQNDLWFGRCVKVVDGTGLSMPDTKKNQEVYPQNGEMKPGCGFPQLNMVALFSLASGVMIGYAKGSKHKGELTLWKKLWKLLVKGDILLGDRGYLSYGNIVLIGRKGVDSVLRWKDHIKQIKRVERLGDNDWVYSWKRPASPPTSIPREKFKRLPEMINIRIIEAYVGKNGFRTQNIKIATTLLDPALYPKEDIVRLYFRRWEVELRLRDIKTTMGMEVLKGKSPMQVKKEIAMFAIAYNLIRGIMLDAARAGGKALTRVSFSDSLSQLRQWMDVFYKAGRNLRGILMKFYHCITQKTVPDRPGRNEPRVKKRRPKNFRLMTKPRAEMIVDCHRNRPEKKNAFYCLK